MALTDIAHTGYLSTRKYPNYIFRTYDDDHIAGDLTELSYSHHLYTSNFHEYEIKDSFITVESEESTFHRINAIQVQNDEIVGFQYGSESLHIIVPEDAIYAFTYVHSFDGSAYENQYSSDTNPNVRLPYINMLNLVGSNILAYPNTTLRCTIESNVPLLIYDINIVAPEDVEAYMLEFMTTGNFHIFDNILSPNCFWLNYTGAPPISQLKLYTEAYVQDIADAIREVSHSTDKYLIEQMGDEVRKLTGPSRWINLDQGE